MSHVASKAARIALDLCVLSAAFVLAFLIRFDWTLPRHQLDRCIILLPYVVAFKYGVLHLHDVPRFAWRYIGLREVTRILQALVAATLVLAAVRLAARPLSVSVPLAGHALIPYGTIAIDGILSFLGVVGLRAMRRLIGEHSSQRAHAITAPAVDTMLVGAGQEGLLVVREIAGRPDLAIRVVGFVDDDPLRVGTIVHGIPVLGTTDKLAELCAEKNAQQVLITMPEAPGKVVRRLVEICERAAIKVKTIPGLSEIMGEKVGLTWIRDVAIEDLLRREPVRLDTPAIERAIQGQVVLVTGAGGSIGSELCRQICRYQPAALLLVDHGENNLFEIHRELTHSFPEQALVPLVADVTDEARLRTIFRRHKPRMVLHAAAYKHVPMMEWNPGEAIKNNVIGTKTVADLSHEHGVSEFVLISTDKAVNPTSIMGATKRAAELYVQALGAKSETRFVAVRFGNVLGSAGSVVPIFKEQIAQGGPVTVTHPEMRRYFMTIPEASQLVIQAATMGNGGEIFILDMGEPVRIVELAEDLIRLSGLRPGEDIEIRFSGMRPGEKLFEELSVAEESADQTFHPKIFVGRIPKVTMASLEPRFARLVEVAQEGELASVKDALHEVVPELVLDPVADAAPAPEVRESRPASGTRESKPVTWPAVETA